MSQSRDSWNSRATIIEARERLHASFRELGYTTNSQTRELLDLVFVTPHPCPTAP